MDKFMEKRKSRLPTFTLAENLFLLNHDLTIEFYKAKGKGQQKYQITKEMAEDMERNYEDPRDWYEITCRLNNLRAQYLKCLKRYEQHYSIKWRYFQKMTIIMDQVEKEIKTEQKNAK